MKDKLPYRTSLSLRIILLLLFTLQILIAVGLTGFISYRNGQKTVDDMAEQLCNEVMSRVDQHLDNYLSAAQSINNINLHLLGQGMIDLTNVKHLTHYFWDQGQMFKGIGTIAYANAEGEFFGANQPENYIVLANHEITRGAIRRYAPDNNGYMSDIILTEKPHYDARTRPWYRAAQTAGKAVWAEVSPSVTGARLDLAAVTPYYDRDKKLRGVFMTDVSLTEISTFLNGLKIGKTGILFIIERNGNIVASSFRETPFIVSGSNNEVKRLSLRESKNPLIAPAVDKMSSQGLSLKDIATHQRLTVALGGNTYFLQIAPYQNMDLNFLKLVLIPEVDFTQHIQANNRTTLLLIFVALIISGLFGIWTSRWVVNPIQDLSAAAKALGEGKWDQPLVPYRFDEVGELAQSFEVMTKQLRHNVEALQKEIAERLQIENQLQDALKKAEDEKENTLSILAAISDGISIQDRTFRVLYQNQAHKDLMGSHIGEYCYAAYQKRESVCVDCHLLQTFQNGRIFTKEKTSSGDTGTLYVEITSSPVKDSTGNIVAGIELVKNITERKKAALFIKNILQHVDDGFVVVDREYKIQSANKAFCDKMNISPEDAIGLHCYEVSHRSNVPCFEAGVHCAVYEAFETGKTAKAIHGHFDRGGKEFVVETKAFPLDRDANGTVITAIETVRDITAERKLEEQLRQAQKMEAIGHLAGGIAHDFNNILMAISGYASLTQMKLEESDPLRMNIDHILSAADRAAQLTQSLLAFGRKQIINMQPENLNDIITRARKLIRPLMKEDISIETPPSVENLTVLVDSIQIEHVLMNLATNARDAMPEGGTFTIEAKSVELDESFMSTHSYGKPGTYALISVSDTGKGMDEKTRIKIFEPFYTTKEVGKGTGLGLSMAYGIVKQHEGYIDVYSESGMGTIFKIYLPLHSTKSESNTEPAPLEQKMEQQGRGETILLAEDDESIRLLLSGVLSKDGYRLIVAVDGEDAIRKFIEHKEEIQLFLSDVIMPKRNGREAYKEIMKIKPDVKALFLSGYSEDVIAKGGIIDEGLKFVSKPVMIKNLLSMVREVLDT